MKRLILTLFCIAILAGCTMQKKPEAKTELSFGTPYNFSPEFLNGHVKSVVEKAYWASEQDGEYIQGNHITQKERDSLGYSDDFIVYFDSLGTTQKVEYLDDEGIAYGYWELKSEDGKITRAQWFQGDSSSTYWRYTYDDSGNITKAERFRLGADTLLNGANVTSLKKWQWTIAQFYNSKGDPGNTTTREFNDMALVTHIETKDPEGKVISWWKDTYDEGGMTTGTTGMSSDSTMYDYEMKYTEFDEMDNFLKRIYFEKGKVDAMDVRIITY
jgi:hypothetical protein